MSKGSGSELNPRSLKSIAFVSTCFARAERAGADSVGLCQACQVIYKTSVLELWL